jgi:hypothetical protein
MAYTVPRRACSIPLWLAVIIAAACVIRDTALVLQWRMVNQTLMWALRRRAPLASRSRMPRSTRARHHSPRKSRHKVFYGLLIDVPMQIALKVGYAWVRVCRLRANGLFLPSSCDSHCAACLLLEFDGSGIA